MQQEELDNSTQLGAPYPILIRGHSLRRTRAPLSSTSQLDSNFDAITLDGTTTRGAGSSSRADSRRQEHWDPDRRTSSPLDDDFDLMTSSAGLTTERGSIYSSSGRSHTTITSPPRVVENGSSKRTPDRSTLDGNNRLGVVEKHPKKAAHSRKTSGPRFEVVKSQVVEDGPERTVTVSLWREQVTKRIGPNGETMSVHYYSADDMLPTADGFVSEVIPDPQTASSPRNKTPSELSYRHPRSEMYYHSQSPPPRASTPTPTGRTGGPTPSPPYYYHHHHYPQQQQTSPKSLIEPSPIRPSHAVIDNSLSTIKSLPTIELERILDSCEPSLVHIAPILACLGITREGHLKAIGRLSEETRDKEVREEALRLGMTVMEWAILLDRLHSL